MLLTMFKNAYYYNYCNSKYVCLLNMHVYVLNTFYRRYYYYYYYCVIYTA